MLLGRKQEAEAEDKESIKLDPAFAPAKRGSASLRGESLDDRSQQQEMDQLRALSRVIRRNVLAREALARVYLERRQIGEAEAELRQIRNWRRSSQSPMSCSPRSFLRGTGRRKRQTTCAPPERQPIPC